VVGLCEHGDEHSGFINAWRFLGTLQSIGFSKEDFGHWFPYFELFNIEMRKMEYICVFRACI
jgi:hypothetical protein